MLYRAPGAGDVRQRTLRVQRSWGEEEPGGKPRGFIVPRKGAWEEKRLDRWPGDGQAGPAGLRSPAFRLTHEQLKL